MPNLSPSIDYTIEVQSVQRREFVIQQQIKSTDTSDIIVYLPSWIPGSYMIRDFAKNITSLRAKDDNGQPLTIKQIDKQRWSIENNNRDVTVDYTVYGNDLSVRSAYIDEDFCFFNGTSVFLAVQGQEDNPIFVTLKGHSEKPEWTLASSMRVVDKNNHRYAADNYQDLIEHPVLMGDLVSQTFETDGIAFEMVFSGLGKYPIDIDRVCRDVKVLCQHHIALFGSAPDISHYPFLTMVTENGYGGLEHTSSTALMCSKEMLPTLAMNDDINADYQNFLSLCSHEFFHTWHIKRIKPRQFQTLDLSQEVYTEQLWLFEGVTSYYDDLSLNSAELVDAEQYLAVLAKGLTRLIRNFGSERQTVTESSFNAWTKFYKQDENAVNAIVNYYNKGAIIALCIDLYLRQNSQGVYCLKDIMQYLWQDYLNGNTGTLIDSVQSAAKNACSIDLSPLLSQALYSTDTLPYQALLATVGVECQSYAAADMKDLGGKATTTAAVNYLGAVYSANSIGVTIDRVMYDSPAEKAGLKAKDILISINCEQVNHTSLQSTLNAFGGHQSAELHVLRRGQMKTFWLPLEAPPANTMCLTVSDKALAQEWLWFKPS